MSILIHSILNVKMRFWSKDRLLLFTAITEYVSTDLILLRLCDENQMSAYIYEGLHYIIEILKLESWSLCMN